MDAFDKLGPKTRKFLNFDMVVEWDAKRTYENLACNGMSDTQVAKKLLADNERIKQQIREMYENPD